VDIEILSISNLTEIRQGPPGAATSGGTLDQYA